LRPVGANQGRGKSWGERRDQEIYCENGPGAIFGGWKFEDRDMDHEGGGGKPPRKDWGDSGVARTKYSEVGNQWE